MQKNKKKILLLISGCLFMTTLTKADDISDIYGSEEMISIATGYSVPKKNSPSVTSILTSAEIESIGARRLEDVIEYLPGIHVSTARAGNKTIGFRGVYSEANNQVLILINGIPLRNIVVGGKPLVWTMPVKNISQVEVIRGPGSMLYGGDAITGVINVITKTGSEIRGGNIGGFFGSQNTYEGWMQYGNKNEEWEYSISLQGGSTNGSEGIIEQDTQSYLDKFLGTQVSNAPGKTNFGRDDVDMKVDIDYKDWLKFRAGYQNFIDVETGEGGALALDEEGKVNQEIYNMDLSIENNLSDQLKLNTNLFFIGQNTAWDYNLLPRGSIAGLLPVGAISQTSYFQGTVGITNNFTYLGVKNHSISFGIGSSYHWTENPQNKLNYQISSNFIQQVPLTDVSTLFGSDALKQSRNRANFYALIQDEWNFFNDFYLTTGFRYDYYSDVSDGFSPRASLVWNINNDLTAKLLYSRSFRPPSFLEKNQPSKNSNTIKSETMDTLEFQIENRWSPQLITSVNAFWFQLDNLITSSEISQLTSETSLIPMPISFSNTETINGAGLETEFRYKYNENFNFKMNYSFHNVTSGNQSGLFPEHMVKSLINWKFYEDWDIGFQLNWIGERKRPKNDSRTNLSGYFMAGATLSTKIAKPLEFTLRVNNIFGTNAKEPSLNSTLLPGDIPVHDRSILGQIKWSF